MFKSYEPALHPETPSLYYLSAISLCELDLEVYHPEEGVIQMEPLIFESLARVTLRSGRSCTQMCSAGIFGRAVFQFLPKLYDGFVSAKGVWLVSIVRQSLQRLSSLQCLPWTVRVEGVQQKMSPKRLSCLEDV
jgi:hypothetical protein